MESRSVTPLSTFSNASDSFKVHSTSSVYIWCCGFKHQVIIRVRPPLNRELDSTRHYEPTVFVDSSCRNITISENLEGIVQAEEVVSPPSSGLLATHRFTFDHIFDIKSEQEDVYVKSSKNAILSVLEGYNATIIAYGQTGTGKTYTMEGKGLHHDGISCDTFGILLGSPDGLEAGIIPRAIHDIFSSIERDPDPSRCSGTFNYLTSSIRPNASDVLKPYLSAKPQLSLTSKYLVRASYMQIYNDAISDLLKEDRVNLSIREDSRKGVYVHHLSEWVVRSPKQVYELMAKGATQRATGTTNMNEVSSRSHAILRLIVEKSTITASDCLNLPPSPTSTCGSTQDISRSVKVGKLNLVDLAGSERVHVTGATGRRLEETKKINQSLSALGNVISAMTACTSRSHIPFRDSKLTRILEDSIGGNCKTIMLCMISPALEAFAESVSTLKFANRAKKIKNEAVVNEDLDQKALLRKYERELKILRSELKQRNADLVEEQKRRAERDKLAAITALEERSREFMREKRLKEKLEKKINTMQSQLLLGGRKIEDTPAFRTLVAMEHKKIRNEYEARLKELEKERESVEADKAQVDRYKRLLLKQRDIMIALTARLNERDEQILSLQVGIEELDAMEQHQKQLEDGLDKKTRELLGLRKAAFQQCGDPHLQHALAAWGRDSDEL
eukprot:g1014.t1